MSFRRLRWRHRDCRTRSTRGDDDGLDAGVDGRLDQVPRAFDGHAIGVVTVAAVRQVEHIARAGAQLPQRGAIEQVSASQVDGEPSGVALRCERTGTTTWLRPCAASASNEMPADEAGPAGDDDAAGVDARGGICDGDARRVRARAGRPVHQGCGGDGVDRPGSRRAAPADGVTVVAEFIDE